MAAKIAIAGVVIALLPPLAFGALALFAHFIPGCSLGGSGGPAYGCSILGIGFNWLISWATPAFVISFFSIPIGMLVTVVGAVAAVVSGRRKGPKE
jgi:hypothetical protein